MILVGTWGLCELLVIKAWPLNASVSNRTCGDWESLNEYINYEVKQNTRLNTWPDGGWDSVVEGEVTAVAGGVVATVANLNFSEGLI